MLHSRIRIMWDQNYTNNVYDKIWSLGTVHHEILHESQSCASKINDVIGALLWIHIHKRLKMLLSQYNQQGMCCYTYFSDESKHTFHSDLVWDHVNVWSCFTGASDVSGSAGVSNGASQIAHHVKNHAYSWTFCGLFKVLKFTSKKSTKSPPNAHIVVVFKV